MAHDIETNTTTNGDVIANFVSARIPAWHRLGTVFPTAMTVGEALEAAHLARWNVRKLPATATETVITEDGVTQVTVLDPRNSLAVRTNPITGALESLGPVGNSYGVVQNEEHGAFLEALLDQSGARFVETAGALDEGRQVFFTAKLPEPIMVGGVDAHDVYVAALNSHDASRAFTTLVTPTRIVCANTQGAALRNARQRWTRRHSSNVMSAVAEARQTMELTHKYLAGFLAEADRMINEPMTAGEFEQIVAGLFPLDEGTAPESRKARNRIEKLDVIRTLWDAPTQAAIAGTRWAGYNALTEYSDWFSGVSGEDEATRTFNRARNAVSPAYMSDKSAAFQAFRVPATAGA